jgi:hypothetical protein
MIRTRLGLGTALCACLLLSLEPAGASRTAELPEPDSLAELTARICGLGEPSASLSREYEAELRAAGRAAPTAAERQLHRRLARLAGEVGHVCHLYRSEGERLFLGQEVSAIYRRRRAVERGLARAPHSAAFRLRWEDLRQGLVRLHEAVDWGAFNYWYLERDGDSD